METIAKAVEDGFQDVESLKTNKHLAALRDRARRGPRETALGELLRRRAQNPRLRRPLRRRPKLLRDLSGPAIEFFLDISHAISLVV